MNSINVLIIGAGFWCERNYLRQIIKFNDRQQIHVKGIVDIKDIGELSHYDNLQQIISSHKPSFLRFTSYKESRKQLDEFIKKNSIDVIIISSDPISHQFYIEMAARNNVRAICDKPPLVHEGSAFDLKQAKSIYVDYKKAIDSLEESKGGHVSVILRRRFMEPFELIADNLQEQHNNFGVGLNHLSLDVDGGVWKLGDELIYQGAHSYTAGVGSLSHSAYHYIDLINWYIKSAPGQSKYILPQLNYAYRVKDYLNSDGFEQLEAMLDHKSTKSDFSDAILNSELNVSFTLTLLDEQMNKTGYVTLNVNHLTFTPRTLGAQLNHFDHANFENGGRTSSLKLSVNQSFLQSANLLKNDIVFNKNNILLDINRHPNLRGRTQERLTYIDAYEVEQQRMDSTTLEVLRGSPKTQAQTDLSKQRVNMNLLSKMYVLLAADYNVVEINKEELLITL